MNRLLLIVATALIAPVASAATIAGRVQLTDDRPLPGVTVTLPELKRTTITDQAGAFSFDDVPSGTYTVSFQWNQLQSEDSIKVSGARAELLKTLDWNIEFAETITVTAASRRRERIEDAPAAVSVVDANAPLLEESTGQAPRLLSNLTGVDSVQSGLFDFNFTARGFNKPLNRRVLVLLDGRDTSFPFLGAQQWAAFSLPLGQLQSTEFVRGPRSALYGANAYSGVISMVSKPAAADPGTSARLTFGELDTRRVDLTHAGSIGRDWAYRVTGAWQESDDFARSRLHSVEYPGLISDVLPLRNDTIAVRSVSLRLDRTMAGGQVATIEGGTATTDGTMLMSPVGRGQFEAERPWLRLNYSTSHSNALAYYDSHHSSEGAILTSGAPLRDDSRTFHFEWQGRRTMGRRATLAGGVSYNDQRVDTADEHGIQTLLDRVHNEQQQGVFAQLDLELSTRLRGIVAGRWDDSTLHDAQVSPKVALLYELTPAQTVRIHYNQGFQAPNFAEYFVVSPAGPPLDLSALESAFQPLLGDIRLGFGDISVVALGNPSLKVEKVRSVEMGYSAFFRQRMFVGADVYVSRLTDFVTDLGFGINPQFADYQPPTGVSSQTAAMLIDALRSVLPPPLFAGLSNLPNGQPAFILSFTNAGLVNTRGFEGEVHYWITPQWSAEANYSWFDFDVREEVPGNPLLPNAPEHRFNAALRFVDAKWKGSILYRWVDSFDWSSGLFIGPVPSYSVTDLAIERTITDQLRVALNVANLFNDEHYELFGGDILRRRALVSLSWRSNP